MKKTIFAILGVTLMILVVLAVCFVPGGSPKPQSPKHSRSPLVVSYHEAAEKAGYRILDSGGNAFDAFVGVTMVENVVSSGSVTLAGLLSTLIYHASSGEVVYLDGGFDSVSDPEGNFDPKHPAPGKKVAVPGVVAGLEAISQRYGRLSFAEVLQPAIKIARDGFVIDERFASFVRDGAEKLKLTEYGRRTFFPNGVPLGAGDTVKQPELADFLAQLAEKGAAYMYKGEWAAQLVKKVRKEGGLMKMADLSSYRPIWTTPWRTSYRGYDICATSGRSMFGLHVLLALKTLEHTDIRALGHFSQSPGALEILVRIARAVLWESWTRKHQNLDNSELVNSRLTPAYTAGIWDRVKAELKAAPPAAPVGHDTLSSVVADTEGNVVSGKHSINSELWGDGWFIQGVLLNATADALGRYTGPGRRRTQGAGNFLVFKEGRLKYACGTFSLSNPDAAFQFLVNILDYELSPGQAVALPRFGSFPYDMKTGEVDWKKNDLDVRFSPEIVKILEERGLYFNQKNPKTGKGCIVEFFPDGSAGSAYDKVNSEKIN